MSSVTSSATPRASRTSLIAASHSSACDGASSTRPPPAGQVASTVAMAARLASISSGSRIERSADERSSASFSSDEAKSGSRRASTGSSGGVDGPVRMPVRAASSSSGASAPRPVSICSIWPMRPRSTDASGRSSTAT